MRTYKIKITAFQSTPSVWRETRGSLPVTSPTRYFNPLPPCGGRPLTTILTSTNGHKFQSTPSVWRETYSGFKSGFFS